MDFDPGPGRLLRLAKSILLGLLSAKAQGMGMKLSTKSNSKIIQ